MLKPVWRISCLHHLSFNRRSPVEWLIIGLNLYSIKYGPKGDRVSLLWACVTSAQIKMRIAATSVKSRNKNSICFPLLSAPDDLIIVKCIKKKRRQNRKISSQIDTKALKIAILEGCGRWKASFTRILQRIYSQWCRPPSVKKPESPLLISHQKVWQPAVSGSSSAILWF